MAEAAAYVINLQDTSSNLLNYLLNELSGVPFKYPKTQG